MYKLADGEDLSNSSVKTHPYIDGYGLDLRHQRTIEFDNGTCVDELRQMIMAAHTLRYLPNGDLVPLSVVVEDFVLTRNSVFGQAKWSLEVRGMVVAIVELAKLEKISIVLKQKSSDAKPAVKDDKLEEFGFKKKRVAIVDHEKDAMRHAILYTSKLRNKAQSITL